MNIDIHRVLCGGAHLTGTGFATLFPLKGITMTRTVDVKGNKAEQSTKKCVNKTVSTITAKDK